MTENQKNVVLRSHQEWLTNQYGNGRRADFRGACLRHVNFAGADLRWADFRAADCTGVDFSKADCRNADFRGADLTNARCVGTVLVNARLDGANLAGVDFRSAVMEYAQLAGANANREYMPEREKPAATQQARRSKNTEIER